LAIKNNSSNCW